MQVPVQLYIDGELRFISTSRTVDVTNLKKGNIFETKELALLGPSFSNRNYIIDDFTIVPQSKDNIEIVRIYLKTTTYQK